MNKFETDSRKVKQGQIFVAIKGHTVDGHDYIEEAVKAGASEIVCEHPVKANVKVTVVPSSLDYLKENLALEYKDKLSKLKIIGVTGTNGKTTTCYLTYQLLNLLNVKAAYM